MSSSTWVHGDSLLCRQPAYDRQGCENTSVCPHQAGFLVAGILGDQVVVHLQAPQGPERRQRAEASGAQPAEARTRLKQGPAVAMYVMQSMS